MIMHKILVIEDDPTVRLVFSQFLANADYAVLVAENGKVGMAMMEKHRPDLIVTDILMPTMDGLEILMEIRKRQDATPVIAISGGMRNLPISFLKQARLLGASHVFEKPVPLDVLLDAIRELLAPPAP